jgi:uncharacterized membrane protein
MRRITKNKKTRYIILAIAVILVAILLFNGGHWMHGMGNHRGFSNMAYINWTQVLISLIIGVVIGLFVAKRKW